MVHRKDQNDQLYLARNYKKNHLFAEIADFIDLFISLRMIRFINRVHTCHQSVPEAFNSVNEVVRKRRRTGQM